MLVSQLVPAVLKHSVSSLHMLETTAHHPRVSVTHKFALQSLGETGPHSTSPGPPGFRNILSPSQVELMPNASSKQFWPICVSQPLRLWLSIESY